MLHLNAQGTYIHIYTNPYLVNSIRNATNESVDYAITSLSKGVTVAQFE